ncbi:hypothetical protein LCGC14_0589270, partial [marine sediment metagenome]|nr:hypothetical protein [Methylophaga sp.]
SFGRNNGGCSFDGFDDFLDLGFAGEITNGVIGANAGNSTWSWSLWINVQDATNRSAIMSVLDTVSVNGAFAWTVEDEGVMNFSIFGEGFSTNSDFYTGTIDVADKQWHHVAAVVNVSLPPDDRVKLYVDGVLDTTTRFVRDGGFDGRFTGVGEDLLFGATGGNSNPQSRLFNGSLDEVRLFNRSISDAEVLSEFHGTQGFQIIAGESQYFNVTNSSVFINLSTSIAFTPFQSYITFNATQIFTGNFINGVNVSATAGSNNQFVISTTNQVASRLSADTFTIAASANNHFNATSFTITTEALQNTTIQLTFGDAKFNFTVFESLQNITITSGFTLNVSPTNLTTFSNRTTTTPDILDFILLQGNTYDFTADFTGDLFTSVTGQFTIDAATGNISIFSLVLHSINIQFFDEETNLPLIIGDNETFTLDLIGPSTKNLTTGNGTIFIANLTPGDYEIRYKAPDRTKRSFFFALPPGGSNQLDLFLLNSSLDTLVVVNVVDENDDPINASIVKLLRFYSEENIFKIIEMSRSDFNGDAPFNVILNTQEYRFLVDFPLGTNIFASATDSKIISTTLTIRPTLGVSRLAFVKGLNLLSTSLIATKTGNNVTFIYTFSDGTGFLQDACLRVDKLSLVDNPTNICEVCTSANTAVLICNVNITSGTLQGYGLVNSTNPHSFITDSLQVIISAGVATFGAYGVFLAALVFISITAIGLFSVGAAVIAGILALTVSSLMGFVAISGGALLGLLISGVLLFIKTRGR